MCLNEPTNVIMIEFDIIDCVIILKFLIYLKSYEFQVNGDKLADVEDEEEEDEVHVNIFQTTVVEGKRRHFVPKGNKETDEW